MSAFRRVLELLSWAAFPLDPGSVDELAEQPQDLGGVEVGRASLEKVLETARADGIVVLHKGAIIF
jgi:hypothetical protein